MEKGSYISEEEKRAWNQITTLDFMSSEESGTDDGEEIILTKPLPWLSSTVKNFFRKLDEAALLGKSPQARRQMKQRRFGPPSLRQKPSSSSGIPDWAFN